MAFFSALKIDTIFRSSAGAAAGGNWLSLTGMGG